MRDWTEDDANKVAAIAAGRAVMMNVNLGFGVRLKHVEGGRYCLSVIDDLKARGPAELAWIEETAVRWLELNAPHRLNYGCDHD